MNTFKPEGQGAEGSEVPLCGVKFLRSEVLLMQSEVDCSAIS